MKKISVITFHASYNYGSCLQAYALQSYINKITSGKNYKYEIINLRTEIQKNLYKNIFEKRGLKNNLKKILFIKNKSKIMKKKENFEHFINKYLNVTKEYSSLAELKKANFKSNYYIAGSDQLWNLQAKDFDWSNFLEFANNGKILSYAASFGPKKQCWNDEEKRRIKNDLLRFNEISVREFGSYTNVKELISKESEIHVDPTMLISKEEWLSIIDNKRLIEGDYIFLYNLKDNRYLELAKKISKELGIPIVISKYKTKLEIIYGFKIMYECGPLEFLNLIKNAKLVLSSSFHGTIFSILLQKPFFALYGNNDLRINTLLEKMNLKNRSIEVDNYIEKCKYAYEIDFSGSERLLDIERAKSEKYLKNVLDIK